MLGGLYPLRELLREGISGIYCPGVPGSLIVRYAPRGRVVVPAQLRTRHSRWRVFPTCPGAAPVVAAQSGVRPVYGCVVDQALVLLDSKPSANTGRATKVLNIRSASGAVPLPISLSPFG